VNSDEINALGTRIVGAAYRVHTEVGPGMLESAYCACLVHELTASGLNLKVEVPVPLIYQGIKLGDVGYRIDILVEDEIILEVKSIQSIAPVHLAQLVSYLKLADRRLGYLINFNVDHLKDGIKRRVNRL